MFLLLLTSNPPPCHCLWLRGSAPANPPAAPWPHPQPISGPTSGPRVLAPNLNPDDLLPASARSEWPSRAWSGRRPKVGPKKDGGD